MIAGLFVALLAVREAAPHFVEEEWVTAIPKWAFWMCALALVSYAILESTRHAEDAHVEAIETMNRELTEERDRSRRAAHCEAKSRKRAAMARLANAHLREKVRELTPMPSASHSDASRAKLIEQYRELDAHRMLLRKLADERDTGRWDFLYDSGPAPEGCSASSWLRRVNTALRNADREFNACAMPVHARERLYHPVGSDFVPDDEGASRFAGRAAYVGHVCQGLSEALALFQEHHRLKDAEVC